MIAWPVLPRSLCEFRGLSACARSSSASARFRISASMIALTGIRASLLTGGSAARLA